MLELTHVHVLFRNSYFANDFNFNVNEPVRVEVEVYVGFATSLLLKIGLQQDKKNPTVYGSCIVGKRSVHTKCKAFSDILLKWWIAIKAIVFHTEIRLRGLCLFELDI